MVRSKDEHHMAGPQDILRYLADLAPEGRKVFDVVHRSSEFAYLGWRPSLVEPVITDGSSTLREVANRDLNRLAAIDSLHPAERLLRIGWLFLCGSADFQDKPTRFCVPLLSAPIRLQRWGPGAHRVIHEGDVEMPDALFDDTARELLENSSDPFGGGAVPTGRELLDRMPRFQSWIAEAVNRAGLPPARVEGPDADPMAGRQAQGLRVFAGAAVYTVRDTAAPNVRGALLGWASENLSGTAFETLYASRDDEPPGAELPIESPLPLNARQREALARARHESITVVSGPPGTGKSHLVAAAAIDEVGRGHTVLVATQSTYAADVIADLLERNPGPRFIRFGRREHRASAAAELSEGMARPYSPAELSQLEEGLAKARRQADGVRARLQDLLAREQAFSEGLERRDALTLMTSQAPGVLDEDTDLQEVDRLLTRATGTRGLLARFRRNQAEKQLRRIVGARSDATLEQIAVAIDAAHAEAAVRDGLTGGGLTLEPLWRQLEQAESSWRIAAGEAIEARRRARRNNRRTSTRAVAALASALRAGRVQRRRTLRDLSGDHFLDVLPLWLGTLTEIDDTLPTSPGMFDVVIFDEASQIDQTRAAPALARARRAMIVGDPRQLRHVSFVADEAGATAARAHGIDGDLARLLDVRRNSLFDAAAGAAPVTWLDEHFRSVPHIIAFSDRTFYGGKLRYMTQHPATETRDAIRVRPVRGNRDTSGVNRAEVEAVLEEIRSARAAGATSVGVVTPFRAQADALEESVLDEFGPEELERLGLRTGTVHAFQGNERDVVIASLTISKEDLGNSLRFVEDPNLLNVLVTRARTQMILVTSLEPEHLPKGLLADYLRHAHHPPLPSQASARPVGWIADLAGELATYSVAVTANYPVAGWHVDLSIGDGPGAIGVECAVHPSGPGAHIERHQALRRAGWRITDCFQSRWLARPDAAAARLAGLLIGPEH
jgi:KaiC/GvpD/RAD55 family RecA-like ATPase